ncbi:MAG: hypothetical protein EPN80_04330 [Pandoraea sp.]|nr:MAG: hypothetical protein EPN80_04330 [Pandoraea sp.]TAM19201.1 MAG: hypothetical protein EPN65_04375 [Pandoraea sp.]
MKVHTFHAPRNASQRSYWRASAVCLQVHKKCSIKRAGVAGSRRRAKAHKGRGRSEVRAESSNDALFAHRDRLDDLRRNCTSKESSS